MITEGGWLAGPEEVIRSEFTDSLTGDIREASFSHARWSPGSDSTKASGLQGNLTGPERPANTCHPPKRSGHNNIWHCLWIHMWNRTDTAHVWRTKPACFPMWSRVLLIYMYVALKIHTTDMHDETHAINHTIAHTHTSLQPAGGVLLRPPRWQMCQNNILVSLWCCFVPLPREKKKRIWFALHIADAFFTSYCGNTMFLDIKKQFSTPRIKSAC